MISHLSLETRAKVRRGDVPKSGPKHKPVAFVSTFIPWMKKLIIFCVISIGIYIVNVQICGTTFLGDLLDKSELISANNKSFLL